MDSPAKAALGGALISALAVGGMLAAGLLATSAVVVASDPTAPPARADGLVRFDDCATLREWYVDHAVGEVGPWGWGDRVVPMMVAGKAAARESSGPVPDQGIGNGPTGTNTQEVGVDEPDMAKTDARIVVRLRDGRHLVVADVSGAAPRDIASWPLPSRQYADALLLVNHHAVLTTTTSPLVGREGFLPHGGRQSTDVYDVDLSDPATPRLDGHSTWPGQQLSMRQYGDTVRLVTTMGLPPLRFVEPRPGTRSRQEAAQQNRAIVRTSSIGDWIPGLTCGEVYRPGTWSGPETVAVTTFRPARPTRSPRWRSAERGARSTPRPIVSTSPRPTGPGPGRTSTPSRWSGASLATWRRASSTAPSATAGPWTSTMATSASQSPGPRCTVPGTTGSSSWTSVATGSSRWAGCAVSASARTSSRCDGSTTSPWWSPSGSRTRWTRST